MLLSERPAALARGRRERRPSSPSQAQLDAVARELIEEARLALDQGDGPRLGTDGPVAMALSSPAGLARP